MGRRTAIGLGFVLAAAGLAQLVPVARPVAPVETDFAAPDEVAAVLRRACYDCHSNETRWPWYAHVAPPSWLVAHDVSDGRRKVNFSTWNRYAPDVRRKKLHESAKEIREGEMPPWYYVLVHPDARLDAEARERLRAFFAAAATGG